MISVQKYCSFLRCWSVNGSAKAIHKLFTKHLLPFSEKFGATVTAIDFKRSVLTWFDNSAYTEEPFAEPPRESRVDWLRIVPFIGMHLACLFVIVTGWSLTAIIVALLSYFVRMFAITGFYHRYFSHRSFQTSRPVQFVFALLGAAATQRGPIWWSAHHRYHHVNSDKESDCHSPRHGFWWSHLGWFLTRTSFSSRINQVPDLARFPELGWLDRFDVVVPALFATGLYFLGEFLSSHYPGLKTNGFQLVVWGYLISTIVLLHVTLLINSLAHKLGTVRFQTGDDSRNSFILALLTMGEGWHNNHHYYPVSARQGFYWWEVDITFYILKCMSMLGLVWGIKSVPMSKLKQKEWAAGGQV